MTGFVGLISLAQFYAALDVYKAHNLIPVNSSAMPTIGARSLMYYLASPEQKREILKRELEEAELKKKIKDEYIE